MAISREAILKLSHILIGDLVAEKRREAEEYLNCTMSHDMYGGECDHLPFQGCWGHVHGKHWRDASADDEL